MSRGGAAKALVTIVLGTLAAIAVVLGSSAPPADADAALTGTITSPAPAGGGGGQARLTTPSFTLSGSFHLSGESPTIDSVTLTVSPEAGQPVPVESTVYCRGTTGGCGGPDATFSWTIPPLAYNGAYRVEATASGTEHHLVGTTDHQGAAGPVEVGLAVPPGAPRALTVKVQPGSRSPVLSWARNGEPDMVGYVVLRTPPGTTRSEPAGSGQVAQPPPSTGTIVFRDIGLPAGGGSYRYDVYAVRTGTSSQDLVASGAPASGTATVAPAPNAAPGGSSSTSSPSSAGATRATTGLAGVTSRLRDRYQGPAPAPLGEQAPDTGFSPVLPFRRAPGGASDALGSDGPAGGARLAGRAGRADSSPNHRALLTSVASASLLFVLAFHVRRLAS
ncbi:MAG: hypothetical protein ACYDAD_13735 [Acidimicrobiales bacterium]